MNTYQSIPSRAPVISTPCALEIAFNKISESGHKKPKLSIAGFTYKRAPDHGHNKGAVYVTDSEDGNYYGKIINNIFIPACATNPVMLEMIAVAMNNPQEEAIKWGRETGECAVCGRRLDNKLSIALGIGPICNEKFGWTLPASYKEDFGAAGDLDDIGEL